MPLGSLPGVDGPGTDSPTLLVTLTGPDRPGVTSRLLGACVAPSVVVLDIEQVLIRGRLVIGVLLTMPRDDTGIRSALRSVATDLGMELDVSVGYDDDDARPPARLHVTVLGATLPPAAMAAIAGRIADNGANIDRIVRMASYPVTAVDLEVSGADPLTLRRALAAEAARQRVDVAVQPADINRHAQRLVVVDVDSTLVQGEVIEMLAAAAGCLPEVAAITAAAMRGELDFAASLRSRVGLLEGLDSRALDAVYESLTYAPGARTMVRALKRLGYRFALVSGGFTQVIDRIAADLGVHYSAANTLEIEDGRLTGRVRGPVLDRAGKAAALRRFAAEAAIPLSRTIAIGDGANDLDMLAAAGLSIAFNAKPIVADAADTALTVPYLDAIVYLLGITREEVDAADAERFEEGPS